MRGFWQKKKSDEKGALLPEYLSAKYLQKYIPNELYLKLSESIPYKNKAGVETDGIKADLLPDICDIYVKAGEKGAFKNAPEISDNAYKIILGFSEEEKKPKLDTILTGLLNTPPPPQKDK